MSISLKFIAILFSSFVIQHSPLSASDTKKSINEIISTLNEPTHQELLLQISKTIYKRDKSKPYIQDKMCTHGSNIVEPWKNYVNPKPIEFASISSSQWRSILQRGGLVIFTDTPENVINDLSTHPEHIRVTKMGGDASSTVVIEIVLNAGHKVGELHTDVSFGKPVGRKAAGSQYSEQDLTHTKLLIDISDIILQMQEKNRLDINVSNLGKISTICPTN
ncbi:MAG: hypothetical protein BGO76_00195 [Caedibacter sp. 38-128]|nr:MAG: hypothetical protein BGO76_00195 [Caedibacter sp. 38-128]